MIMLVLLDYLSELLVLPHSAHAVFECTTCFCHPKITAPVWLTPSTLIQICCRTYSEKSVQLCMHEPAYTQRGQLKTRQKTQRQVSMFKWQQQINIQLDSSQLQMINECTQYSVHTVHLLCTFVRCFLVYCNGFWSCEITKASKWPQSKYLDVPII